MSNFQQKCVNLLSIFISFAIGLIFFKAIIIVNWNETNYFLYKLTFLILLTSLFGVFIIKSNFTKELKIIILIGLTVVIRVWWILNVNSIPVSDFNTMYLSAKELLNGNFSAFREYGYLSRFPHLVCTTLYMALMIKIFPFYHLTAIKIVNVILSVITIFLLYKLSKKFVKKESTSLFVILMAAVFPPFISYTSTYCTENLAIPLYLITMLFFFEADKSKKWMKWVICGSLLALSDLFRGVGVVFLIAFLIYIFLFLREKRVKSAMGLIMGMVITSGLVSLFLMSFNIMDKPLWKGAEPSVITLILKGSNIENGGKWNFEDANFIDKNLGRPDFSKICIKIAVKRIFDLSFLEKINFYLGKFLSQWSVGDFSGTYWATLRTDMDIGGTVPGIFQIIFCVIIFFSLLSVILKRTKKNTIIVHILLCGFILMFMIIETQSRYSYIISWAFLILAVQGMETIMHLLKKSKFKNF